MSILLYYTIIIVSATVISVSIPVLWISMPLILLVSVGWSFVFSVIWFPNAIDWNGWLATTSTSKYDD